MNDNQYKPTISKAIDKALDKANAEQLEKQSREDLNVWIPHGTSGESLVFDLISIRDVLTEKLAAQMAENLEIELPDEMGMLDEDQTAEEFAQMIITAVPRTTALALDLLTVEAAAD